MANLKLNYADGFSETKSMNTVGSFNIVLTADDISWDLSKAHSLAAKIGNASGYLTDLRINLDDIEDKSQGTISIKLDDQFMADFPPDLYFLEVWADTDDGRLIFPSDGGSALTFTINRNIMSNFEGVAKVTLVQFQEDFNELKKIIQKNQAFLDVSLKDSLNYSNDLSKKYEDLNQHGRDQLETDLSNARQNIEDKKSDAHSYVDKVNSDSTNDIQSKVDNAKSYIDNNTDKNTKAVDNTVSKAKSDLANYSSDRQNDVNNTVNSAKSDLTSFSQARQNEINDRVNQLKQTINTQKAQYENDVGNIKNDFEYQKGTYADLRDETRNLLQQLEANEGKVHASVEDIQDARFGAQTKADNAQNQAVQQSANYTNQKYDELNNKNNILSQRVEDYQKPNLLNLNFSGALDVGANQYNYLGTVHLEAGKDYKFAMDLKHPYKNIDHNNNTWVDGNTWANSNDFHVFLKDNKGNWAFDTGNVSYYNSPDYKVLSYDVHINNTNDYILEYDNYYAWLSGNAYLRGAWITETTDVIPFDVAEQNKASIESEGQFSTDYQAPNLVNNIDNWVELNSNGISLNQGTINLKANQSYWFSVEYNYDISKKVDNTMCLYVQGASDFGSSSNGVAMQFNPNWNTNFKQSYQYTPKHDEQVVVYMQRYGDTSNYGAFRHLTVTQSDSYVPYDVVKRNSLWNDRITNKTNDLSNKVDENFKKDNARMDYLGATKYDKTETYNKGEVDNKTDNLSTNIQNVSNKVDSNYNDINNKITNSVNTSIQQANQTTQQLSKKVDDNTARINAMQIHNLAPGTSIAWYGWSGNWQLDGSSIYIEEGKTYWFSCYVDNGPANISSATLNRSGQWFAIAPDVNTGQNTVNSGNYFITKWVADRTGNFYISANTSSSGLRQISKLCITQSDNYIPFEQTDSNPDNNKVATLNYVNDQLARLSKNSWRELKVDGRSNTSTHVLCRIDWTNNKATLVGSFNFPSNIAIGAQATVYSSDDFSFNNGYGQLAYYDLHPNTISGNPILAYPSIYAKNGNLTLPANPGTSWMASQEFSITPK